MENYLYKNNKIAVGIMGATGTVGQRFIRLLSQHPWFKVTCVAASPKSAQKSYSEAVEGRWIEEIDIPQAIKELTVYDVTSDINTISKKVQLLFSAISMDKKEVRELEENYAEKGIPIVSCNSAHRWTADVPMIIPEINPHHLEIIKSQRKKRNWDKGLITVKPNCSIQSYVPVLHALKTFQIEKVIVSTYQAVSGAGKTLKSWPEMVDNVIPNISGEEKKSEDEPLKIWGKIKNGEIINNNSPVISSTCVRVPVSDGHLVSVSVKFKENPTYEEIIDTITTFKNPLERFNLPSSPEKFLYYFTDNFRPQTKLDKNLDKGMAISVGRLRKDPILDWKFVALSHNTIRGAAGGAVLIAELLHKKNYL
ncbi:MAG: aspartate-semialdehyde dehydrogenase [bacterium]